MSKRKFYLVTNWESGVKHGTIFTANGLETETYDRQYRIEDKPGTVDDILPFSLTSSNPNVTLKEAGYKIQIINNTGTSQPTTIRGFYDNLDVKQLYRIVVNSIDSIAESPVQTGTGQAQSTESYLKYEAFGLQGLFDFSKPDTEIKLTMPANTTWYLYATDGGYMSIDRFKLQRRPVMELEADPKERVSYYITELFRYNKLEDIQKFFLPLVDATDIKNPDKSVPITALVASASIDSFDFTASTVQWLPIEQAPSIVNRSKPYFRFKIILPTDRVVAATKIGYAIHTEYGYAETASLYTTIADVEQTVYRPNFQVFIAGKDMTQWVDTVSAGQVTLQIRKIDETRSPIYMQNISVFLDNTTVDSGRITGVTKVEYPNSITYMLKYATYRQLLGANYQDNVFAFNVAPSDITTVPFANEFEYINYIVNYSPASNGVILNTDKFKNMRAMSFWTDQYDTINRTGGMGFGDAPDKWIHYYTNAQKLTLEQIELVANANRLTAEVTHTGSVILSDLIPHDECTLEFDPLLYHKDQSSILSKCTHRYHDYLYTNENGTELHSYIPDHRLYTPEVNYDVMQSASIVRVNGTTGKNQTAFTPTEQYIGTVKGFDKGATEYVQPGQELNYRTQLTTRQPSDFFRIAFFTKNTLTSANEQTLLKGTPKVEGWENVTYETDKGGLFQPSIQSAPAGLKVDQKWINGTLEYEDGDFDDVYGVKFLEVNISTDDLKDEPIRQGFFGALIGFVIALVVVATIAIPGGLALMAGTVGVLGYGGTIAAGTALGFVLGAANGEFVSKINVQLPLKVKGIPAITAHQEYQEAPLIGLPDGKWFPKWARGAYQEMLQAKDNLGIETKVVDNPYVVSLTSYSQPNSADFGGSTTQAYRDAVKYSMYHKDMHNIVASGLTLREWLKARAVSLRYAGNPNWFPYQFIAIAKPAVDSTFITEYEYFYTLGPQSTSITVGGEITTEIQAAYIGSSSGNTDIRFMELLNNSLTLN